MTRILATTVIHDRQIGQSHGSAYLVDLQRKSVHRVIDYKAHDIEWLGREGGRGLRGVAHHDDSLFLTAGDQLLEYGFDFKPRQSWRCDALLDARGLAVHGDTLFVISAGNDCVLGFDLEAREFRWAMHVVSDVSRFKATTFDPLSSADAPLAINKLELRTIQADEAGLRVHGLNSNGLLYFNGKTVTMSVELPEGANDGRLFKSGVLFNDSRAGALRYASRKESAHDRVMSIPFFDPSQQHELDDDEARATMRGYARGLCILGDNVAVVGTTPAGILLFDIEKAERLATIVINRDVDEAINSIAALPD